MEALGGGSILQQNLNKLELHLNEFHKLELHLNEIHKLELHLDGGSTWWRKHFTAKAEQVGVTLE